MKKILYLIGSSLILSSIGSGQNINPLKEEWDDLHVWYTTNVPAYQNFDYSFNNCELRSNSLSWLLSGHLRLYKATQDKAYLIKFINHVIYLQKFRIDEETGSDTKAWIGGDINTYDHCDGDTNQAEPSYFNSLLIHPMAEFVEMVLNEPGQSLYNTNLPIQPVVPNDLVDITTLNSLNPGFPILKYGDFANWLGKRVEETMQFMIGSYWDDAFGMKSHFDENCYGGNPTRTCGTAMNLNAPFGAALVYMYLANENFGYGNNSADYLNKVSLLASFHRQTLALIDLCEGQSYIAPVLDLLPNNSYSWYHAGWGTRNHSCLAFPFTYFPEIDHYTQYLEDVPHGAMDLWFIQLCYQTGLAPLNSTTPYFTAVEMDRFRNTFTKNIYFSDTDGAHFNTSVSGTNTQVIDGLLDATWGEVMNWIILYPFDGNSLPNVYDVLVDHASLVMDNNVPASYPGYSTTDFSKLGGQPGQPYLGLSEVVKAQWEKECINLSLYKRDLVYDQDFLVKNSITVEPQSVSALNSASSFSDPVINTSEFIVQPGVSSNMIAGESIILKPGFTAETIIASHSIARGVILVEVLFFASDH